MDEIIDVITPEQIEQHYNAMLDSVWLVNAIIAGEQMSETPEQEKKDCVQRNVSHLEIMIGKEFWASEDMTAVNAAIIAGNTYAQ